MSTNPYTITDEMVSDILCAAFEGGINYWADNVAVVTEWPLNADSASEVFTHDKDAILRIHVTDDEDQPTVDLTYKAIVKGIRKAAEYYGLTPERFYEEHDAGSADNAVQFAVFGELIYG